MSDVFIEDIQSWCSVKCKDSYMEVCKGRSVNDEWVEEWAIFSQPTWGFHFLIEPKTVVKRVGQNPRDIRTEVDTVERDNLSLKYLLKEWSLGELEFDRSDNLTDKCLEAVMNTDSRIIKAFLEPLNDCISVSDEELKNIEKQSAVLFSEKSKGVSNPNEAISAYCQLGSFAEKFDLNYYDLERFPLKLYIKLKTVMNHENEIRNRQIRSKNNVGRVAGRGGKSRPSRGTVVPNR